MSSLIDIWTVERERIRLRRAVEPFRPVALPGAAAQGGGHVARSDGRGIIAQPCDGTGTPDDVMALAAKKQAASASSPSPAFLREDAFLSILVDCFGQ